DIPCASPGPDGKRLTDLQPDQAIADSPQSFRKQLYCFCIKTLSPQGEGTQGLTGPEEYRWLGGANNRPRPVMPATASA
ncbi:hypothetical protein, partial [Enterobacter intestinihominis]